MQYILARFAEPSTYAGIAAALSALGYNIAPGLLQTITFAGVALAGIAAVILKEGAVKAVTSGDLVAPIQSASKS